jgi:hypothetical protein
MWLLITRQSDGKLTATIPEEQDWQKTNKTFDPNRPNPSVSEFTYRMSRQCYGKIY